MSPIVSGGARRGAASLGLVALLAAPLAGAPGPALAQASPRVVAGDATIGEGLTGAVVVSVQGVQGLYGADVQLSFDPAVLEVQDVNPGRAGVQIQLGTFLAPGMVVRDTADNAAGTIHVAFTQMSPAEARSGSGELFTVIFKALRAGAATDVDVAEVMLADRDGLAIQAATQSGRVTVVGQRQAPPTPTTAALVEPTLVVGPDSPPPDDASSRGSAAGPTSAAATSGQVPPAPPALSGAAMPTVNAAAGIARPTAADAASSSADAEALTSPSADDAPGEVSTLVAQGADAVGATEPGGPPSDGAANAPGGVTSSGGPAEGSDAQGASGGAFLWLALAALLVVAGIAFFTRRG